MLRSVRHFIKFDIWQPKYLIFSFQGPIEPIQSSSPQKKKEKLDQTGDSNPVAVYDDENVNPSQLHQSRLGLVSQSLMMLITCAFLFAETLEEFWKTK